MDNYLKPFDTGMDLEQGTIIQRIGVEKHQQGCFFQRDEDKGLILINILDMIEGSLYALKGVLKPLAEDKIYYYPTTFKNSAVAEKALAVVKEWALYKKHADLQSQIINFVSITYAPEQILDFKKKDALQFLFVPIQQMFRIGRFKERRDPERVCADSFALWLESLKNGNHITYIALVMQQKSYRAKFYSAGTKPHESTVEQLRGEIFNFNPTHGGHIKADGLKNGKKHFIVDAGSNYLGRGVKTPLHISKHVVESLKKLYPDFEFTAMEGRGAFGTEQSY